MKVVKKEESKIFKNSDKCIATEYPTNNKYLNVALIEINGRYPDKGRVINKVCCELLYIIKGSGTVEVDGKVVKFRRGDQVLIEPGEKYYFQAKTIFSTSCYPGWYPEQHKNVK